MEKSINGWKYEHFCRLGERWRELAAVKNRSDKD